MGDKMRSGWILGLFFLTVSSAGCDQGKGVEVPAAIQSAKPLSLPSIEGGGTFFGAPEAVVFSVAEQSVERIPITAFDDTSPGPSASPPPSQTYPPNGPNVVYPSEDPRIVRITGRGPDGDYYCSGAMIAQNLVLTAGHCVHTGGQGGRWSSNVQAWLGYEQGRVRFGPYKAARLISFAGWVDSKDYAHDVAAVQLELGDDLQTHYFYGMRALERPCTAVGSLDPQSRFIRKFYGAGYENGQSQGLTMADHVGCERGLYSTWTVTDHGSSGSPAIDPQGMFIYAVTSSGREDVRIQYDAALTRAKICLFETFAADPLFQCARSPR